MGLTYKYRILKRVSSKPFQTKHPELLSEASDLSNGMRFSHNNFEGEGLSYVDLSRETRREQDEVISLRPFYHSMKENLHS